MGFPTPRRLARCHSPLLLFPSPPPCGQRGKGYRQGIHQHTDHAAPRGSEQQPSSGKSGGRGDRTKRERLREEEEEDEEEEEEEEAVHPALLSAWSGLAGGLSGLVGIW